MSAAVAAYTADVNGSAVTLDLEGMRARRRRILAALVGTALLLALLAAPRPAFGWVLDDVITNAKKMLLETLAGGVTSMFSLAASFINAISPSGYALAEFNSILGGTAIKTIAESLANNVAKPLAASVFSLIMLFQLLKISQHLDGNATMPGLKEVFMLAVVCSVGVWAINNAWPLCSDVFDMLNQFTSSMKFTQQTISFNILPLDFSDLSGFMTMVGQILGSFILGLVLAGLGLFAAFMANVAFIGRGIEVYILAAFAPLMMCFFGFDETKPWAMGYVKSYISTCLQGTLIYFMCTAFPYLLADLIGGSASSSGGTITVDIDITSINVASFIIIGACLFSLTKMLQNTSGLAREILGG